MDALFDQGPFAPCPAPFNLAAYVLSHAQDLGDKIALAVVSPKGAQRWSYAKLEQAVRGVATGFLDAGLPPGGRVILRLGNTVDFPVAYLGAIAAGLIPVPTAAALTTPEITKLADELNPVAVIAGPGVPLPDHPARVITATALEAMFTNPPADYAMGDPDRPAYMVYTSGTSGRPRGVVHAHRAVWARRMMWDGWYGLTQNDRLLHAGAFNWTYTLGTGLLDPWAMGATALIPAADVAASALPLLLKRYDATIFAAAPGVYRQMLKSDASLSLPKLRHGLSAGEKLPEATRLAWTERTGTAIYEALGMSECSTFVSACPGHPATPPASGYPQAGRRLAVLDGELNITKRGTGGQLAISNRDPGMMIEYWNAPDETAERFHGEWFLTGDTVEMAEDGAITYLGRGDDMMNAGGFRVSPVEVEATLSQFPGVAEVAATEIRVKSDATVIAAFYVTSQDVDETALSEFAQTHLARYKQPRLFIKMDALPKGGNGKLNRKALRQHWEADHDQA